MKLGERFTRQKARSTIPKDGSSTCGSEIPAKEGTAQAGVRTLVK